MQTLSNVFRGTTIRTIIEDDGSIRFVASDIADILGYRDAANMTRLLDEDEKGTHIMSTLGGEQQITTINESGLYHAVLKSRKAEARAFRKWVTSDLLPTIRKNGEYTKADLEKANAKLADLEAENRRLRGHLNGASLPPIKQDDFVEAIVTNDPHRLVRDGLTDRGHAALSLEYEATLGMQDLPLALVTEMSNLLCGFDVPRKVIDKAARKQGTGYTYIFRVDHKSGEQRVLRKSI